jgi:hypothetical protein
MSLGLACVQVQWIGTVTRNNSKVSVPISTATRSYDSFKYNIDLPSPTSWRLRIQNAQVTDEGTYTCQVQISNQNYARAYEELVIVGKFVYVCLCFIFVLLF